MISSRQIVDIINDEMAKDKTNQEIRNALKKVKERIEILEEIDYVNTVKQPYLEEPVAKQSKAKQKATEEFEKFFK